jgi:hypothetical protein
MIFMRRLCFDLLRPGLDLLRPWRVLWDGGERSRRMGETASRRRNQGGGFLSPFFGFSRLFSPFCGEDFFGGEERPARDYARATDPCGAVGTPRPTKKMGAVRFCSVSFGFLGEPPLGGGSGGGLQFGFRGAGFVVVWEASIIWI